MGEEAEGVLLVTVAKEVIVTLVEADVEEPRDDANLPIEANYISSRNVEAKEARAE